MQPIHPVTAPTPADAAVPAPAPADPTLPGAYSPPAIIFRARLEATAAFCDDLYTGKSFGMCQGPINS